MAVKSTGKTNYKVFLLVRVADPDPEFLSQFRTRRFAFPANGKLFIISSSFLLTEHKNKKNYYVKYGLGRFLGRDPVHTESPDPVHNKSNVPVHSESSKRTRAMYRFPYVLIRIRIRGSFPWFKDPNPALFFSGFQDASLVFSYCRYLSTSKNCRNQDFS